MKTAPSHRLIPFLLSLLWASAPAHADLDGYRQIDFRLPPDTGQLLIVDADDDGLSDLLAIAGNRLSLYRQTDEDGFDFNTPDAVLELPGRSAGWDISHAYPALRDGGAGDAAVMSVVALIDGNRVGLWQLENGEFGDEHILLSEVDGFPGRGMYALHFSRDLNDDGRDDLIIPGAGVLNLYMRNADGSYQSPRPVLSDMQIDSRLHTGDLINRSVNQSVRIPMLELRDVNADGLPDLIVDTEERLEVFLANAQGEEAYFPNGPSYAVDRTAIRERLGGFDVDQLDFANLTGILALTHEEILEDVNGDGIADALLRESGRVALFLGNESGIDFSTPQQILRSGGNVLTTFLHDENSNGRPDLWLWRVEQVSVGDLFLWLALSGSIDIEAFVYHNEGDQFARRPGRRITVTLRFPSAVRMIGSVRDIRERARSVDPVIPMTRADLGEGELQDLVVLFNEQVQIFRNALEQEPASDDDRFLASLDYSRSRDDYEIDIRRMIDDFEIDINRDLQRVQDRAADAVLPLPLAQQRGDVAVNDLNADGRDDVFLFLQRSNEAVTGLLLLSE